MRTFCIGVGLCLLLAVGADTVHAQNTIDLVPMINKCHAEGYELDSLQSVYLRDVPCNLDGDTIYAIELVSLWSEDCYMFWSHKFQYSFVWWEENHTMYVERDEEYDVDVNRSEWDEVVEWYDTKIFVESMVSQVEHWDKEAMMALQWEVYGGEEFFKIIRIIFDKGNIRTESFDLDNYEDPDQNGGRVPNFDSIRQSPGHLKTIKQHHKG